MIFGIIAILKVKKSTQHKSVNDRSMTSIHIIVGILPIYRYFTSFNHFKNKVFIVYMIIVL